MKVLLINWIYNSGSTGFIMRDLKNVMSGKDIDVMVASGVVKGGKDKNVFHYSNKFEWILYYHFLKYFNNRFQGNLFGTKRLIKFIKQENPDIVNIHVINSWSLDLYKLLDFLSSHGIKTIMSNHAELYYTGACGYAYSCRQFIDNQCKACETPQLCSGTRFGMHPSKMWKLMYDSIQSFKKNKLVFTAVSPWVKERFEMSPITKGYPCYVAMNGIETSVFYRREQTTVSKKGKPCKDYLLFVAANFNPKDNDDVKGGYYLVELAKLMPNVQFVVVASYFSNVEDIPANIILWGKAANQDELATLYSNAKLTVLTSKKETFSMICAESLCCGTPVVGFKAGGPESISMKPYSCFVEHGDLNGLKETINKFIGLNFDRDNISKEAMSLYSKEAMTDGYLEVYRKIMEEK